MSRCRAICSAPWTTVDEKDHKKGDQAAAAVSAAFFYNQLCLAKTTNY
jgi:hypothetical protein